MRSDFTKKRCVIDVETNGYDLWNTKIICIGIMDISTKKITIFYEESEHEETLIMKFLQYFNKMRFNEVIAYNIAHDHRLILSRCLKYGLPANGFYTAQTVDLMQICKGFRLRYNWNKAGSLNQWCLYIFGEGKLQMNDSIPNLYQKGEIEKIKQYNKQDVLLTFRLWQRINSVLGSKSHGR